MARRLPKYGIELWSRDGRPIADITKLCQDISFTEQRNEAEELRFSLDLDAFEDYMINKVGADPVSNFREGQTEIKVKRGKEYLFGTQLFDASITLGADDSATISVVSTGYLNLLRDRYPDPAITYNQVESVQIFFDLIRQAQLIPNGNYGLKIPTSGYYQTGVLRDRTFEQYTSSTKLNLQRLTDLETGKFDFRILADKTVMTYPQVGSPRSDFTLLFDRSARRSSFRQATINRSANGLYNQVIGAGSGFGEDMMLSIQNDTASQIEFGVHQTVRQFNEVSVQSTLDENTRSYRDQVKDLLRLPKVTLSGNNLPEVPVEIGDWIPAIFSGRRLLEDLTGAYRVERKETTLDENGFESSVTFYFEAMGVS